MRILSLLLLLLVGVLPCAPVHAQDAAAADGARIGSVDVSGLPLADLSPGLRRDIDALAGERLDRERLEALARRIEDERPDVVAAVRTVNRSDGRADVVFLVARISEDGDLASNINARYVVESVAVDGIPERDIRGSLWDDLQALVGSRLDPDVADRLSELLERERPGYRVQRRIARGSSRGRIRLIFEFHQLDGPRWIPFTPSRSKLVYHSEQGWSGVLDIPMGSSRHRATVGFAMRNNDDLVEEYSGVRVGLESRRLGTRRLGARIEVSRFNSSWRPETLAALASLPVEVEPYRTRVTVEPSVTVAVNPFLRVTVGASISELESLNRSPFTQRTGALVASVGVSRRWEDDREGRQRIEASYELRSANTALESDLLYRRHTGKARYRLDHGRSTVIADVLVGGITGTAPLFERFALGDSSTLRGWNKFEIAPAGGDRVWHQSLEYRFSVLGLFVDAGSVWDAGADKRIRLGSGFGLHGDNGFLTIGFPLNARELGTTFTMGVRF